VFLPALSASLIARLYAIPSGVVPAIPQVEAPPPPLQQSTFNLEPSNRLFSHSCAPLEKPPLCFHILTKPFSRSPFLLISLQIPRGVVPPFSSQKLRAPTAARQAAWFHTSHMLTTSAPANSAPVAEPPEQIKMNGVYHIGGVACRRTCGSPADSKPSTEAIACAQ
jgi:hypothetical protein